MLLQNYSGLLICISFLVACNGGGSGNVPVSGVGEKTAGVFTVKKNLNAQEIEQIEKSLFGCAHSTVAIDQRLKPGMTFKSSAKFQKVGQGLKAAVVSHKILALDNVSIKKRLTVEVSSIPSLPAGLQREFECKLNSEMGYLDCGAYTEIGDDRKKDSSGSEEDDYCALKGGSPDPKDTYHVMAGTFKFAHSGQTVPAYQLKRVRYGTYKCNQQEGPGQERYTNVISFEVPSFLSIFCRGTFLSSFSETRTDAGQVLHSSLWEILERDPLK